jgi:hypothetical protein
MQTCPQCGLSKPEDQFRDRGRKIRCNECWAINYSKEHHGGKFTIPERNAMLKAQGYKCKLCGKEDHRLVIDHDHLTGRIRGMLCNRCNLMLGFAKDNDPEIFRKAIDYLSPCLGYQEVEE